MARYRFRRPKDKHWGAADGRHALSFLVNLEQIQREFQATDRRGQPLTLQQGFAAAVHMVKGASKKKQKLIFIGNGGSAAIASHQAVDYWKNGGIEALS